MLVQDPARSPQLGTTTFARGGETALSPERNQTLRLGERITRAKCAALCTECEPRARAGGRALSSVPPLAVLAYGCAEAGPQGFGAIPGDLGWR